MIIQHSRQHQKWWEACSAIKVVTLKKGRKYAAQVLTLDTKALESQLEEIKRQGFGGIEIFAPAYGLEAYSGLDTVDFYRIDPELGAMEDFTRLVQLAHQIGLAVTAFLNIGYHSLESPDWKQACHEKKMGVVGSKTEWFLWADKQNAPAPYPEDTYFMVKSSPKSNADGHPSATWGWQYSDEAGSYYWARWECSAAGKAIGLPQSNWGTDAWPQEAQKILQHWLNTGIDGVMVDAPLFYPGLNWERWNQYIANTVHSHPGMFLQPEGAAGSGWITEGQCNCMQNYFLSRQDEDRRTAAYIRAIKEENGRIYEESLAYHDKLTELGAVLYQSMHLHEENPAKRHLGLASMVAIGELMAFTAHAYPESQWIDETEIRLLHLKSEKAALHNGGLRNKLDTSDDNHVYAMVRSASDFSHRMVVVLNFSDSPAHVSVDISGISASYLKDALSNDQYLRTSFMQITLPPYGWKFYDIIP